MLLVLLFIEADKSAIACPTLFSSVLRIMLPMPTFLEIQSILGTRTSRLKKSEAVFENVANSYDTML